MDDTEYGSLSRLDIVLDSGNYRRLAELAEEHLSSWPSSAEAHDYAAMAYLNLDDLKKAGVHIEALRSHAPESARTHHLTAIWHQTKGQNFKAMKHIDEALRLDPDVGHHYYVKALVCLATGKIKKGRMAIENALKLEPENPEFIRIQVLIDSVNDSTASGAWKRLDDLTEALRLDPDDPAIHATIGHVWLEELDDPARAEQSVRTALQLDPTNKLAKRLLFRAVGNRSFLYRTLDLPGAGWRFVKNVLRGIGMQPWRVIFLLIAFKAVLIYFAWLFVASVCFLIPAKIYEWLILSDISATQKTGLHSRGLNFFRGLPLSIRCLLLSSGMIAFWWMLLHFLHIPLRGGFIFLGCFIGFHALVVAVLFLFRKSQSVIGQASTKRTNPVTAGRGS